jgi:hypothetical protein
MRPWHQVCAGLLLMAGVSERPPIVSLVKRPAPLKALGQQAGEVFPSLLTRRQGISEEDTRLHVLAR